MYLRSAYWIGAPKPGADRQFHDLIESELLPAMRAMPGVRAVRGLWPVRLEDSPPGIALQVLVEFAGLEDAQRMLASDERKALRPRVLAAVELFNGHLSHIEFQTLGERTS
ncbi:hypothetical protein QTH91_07945 [Variovorax dokdonensis]|uniref:ABM domain-containing protein n=1 Tax=Variovorax dokdonensis TaxID=344883 RepID=A0ABT7N957_9BURK|nr:hypothetical protein [Variovorax dokdonensis]MDM0044405.1 hypothetical protein [Variovorax dokdonensis]